MERHIFSSEDAVLGALAGYFVATADQAIAARGRFAVALSGGSSPKKLYELLASDAYRAQVAWSQVYFFFGDERTVPKTSPDSNYLMAKKALFDPLAIRPDHVFAIDTALAPAEAAAQYGVAIEEFFGDEPARFDLVLLGLGDNAHTASLFPHTPVLHDQSVGVKDVFVAELDTTRITLTAPLLNQARATAFLVYGAGKAIAVQQILQGPRDVDQYPAQLIAPAGGNVHWFLDEAAAADLK
ncbi:6-phosphogluconolactonase [Hymenobacter sp. PAMC 26628]|uniref:6-phosphogluconolactonase n=1 Tax=Hymenobacter sp. PAMC 26628 TaxID=1484118 RepID=UPI00077031E4|nr:6-phosphogluconolactonase [Hymenobacter sp. PAMC 26628]AMJ64923.1 6-phosphogluconolactonase [Hymenobacter sp. PAMC 26628]